jgi:two-component system CheB/CheR fusion protein
VARRKANSKDGDRARGVNEMLSANQELESSKSELQSVNEELQTVNSELAHRVNELAKTNSDLKNLLESTQIATVFLDDELRIRNFTPAATEIFHLLETDVGRPIDDVVPTVAYPELQRDVHQILSTLGRIEREVERPETGSRYLARVLPYRSLDDSIAGVVLTFLDITATARAEERQRLLLSELQHRVRNILGIVRSLAARTAETSASVDEFASHLDGRLATLARTQNIFARTGDVIVDLEEMVRDELVSLGAPDGEQVDVGGPEVRLRQSAAETFALALHELATNAVKYGALAGPKGRVAVHWRVLDTSAGPRLSLEWRETGVAALDMRPTRSGFGRELIERGLPFELGAATSLSFEPGGVRALIEVPLTEHNAVLDSPEQALGG